MSKRSQQSKDKRRAEQERQKRWGQQQKTRHANQLARDLAYYEERGLFASQAKWSETASQALWDSQDWRGEPEFRDLAFDPYQAGQAMHAAWEELQFDPDEFEKLSAEDKDDRNFQLNACAIQVLLLPEIKKDFLRRLERYRQRLRAGKRWEALAQAGLVQMILETSDESREEVWPECMLVYQIHYEAIEEYLRLQEAAGEVLDHALTTLERPVDAADLNLTETEQAQVSATLEQAAQHTPGLLDFLQQAADDILDEALSAVHAAEINCQLFTKRETNLCFAYFVAALGETGTGQLMPDELPPQERATVRQHIDDAIADCLDEIDTPDRRAELYAAARMSLQHLSDHSEQEQTRSHAQLLLSLLGDDAVPLADNEFFGMALLGEFGARMKAESEASTTQDENSAES